MNPFRTILFALGMVLATTASGADRRPLWELGRALLTEKCARCHAIDARDESPLKSAPPMRDVYERFAPEELKAELAEGIVSRHPQMPQVEFSTEQVDAVLNYLHQLAQKKPSTMPSRKAP